MINFDDFQKDISPKVEYEIEAMSEALSDAYEEIALLYNLANELAKEQKEERLIPHILDVARRLTKADIAWLFLFESGAIFSDAHLDAPQKHLKPPLEILSSKGEYGKTFSTNLPDFGNCLFFSIGTPSFFHGTLGIAKKGEEFTSRCLELFKTVGVVSSLFLEAVRLYKTEYDALKKMQELENLKSGIINSVTHELRTPLTIIRGYISLFDKFVLDQEKRKDAFTTIQRNVDRLTFLITNLLLMSRLESKGMKVSFYPVDFKSLIKRALEFLSDPIKAKQIELSLNLQEHFPPFYGDSDLLFYAVVNLLENAVKFSSQGGIISIRCFASEKDKTLLQFEVADEGKGISKEALPHIFNSFYQADSSTTRQYSGAGVGLTIVKHIVEAHKGRIWAENREPKGAKVSLTLPFSD